MTRFLFMILGCPIKHLDYSVTTYSWPWHNIVVGGGGVVIWATSCDLKPHLVAQVSLDQLCIMGEVVDLSEGTHCPSTQFPYDMDGDVWSYCTFGCTNLHKRWKWLLVYSVGLICAIIVTSFTFAKKSKDWIRRSQRCLFSLVKDKLSGMGGIIQINLLLCDLYMDPPHRNWFWPNAWM